MPSVLDLDPCPLVRVFRAIESIFKADPILSGVVRADAWRSHKGEPADLAALPANRKVCVRLSPTNAADRGFDPSSITEPLSVNVDLQINTTCCDDVYNLWHAFKRALYPPDDATLDNPGSPRFLIFNQLQAAGAETGVCTFHGPALFDKPAADGTPLLVARGIVQIDVINPLNA